MKLHPLFAGFKGESIHAVAHCLGFIAHVETHQGVLPDDLPPCHAARLGLGNDLYGFHYAGGWESPAVHCRLFVKPVTAYASACWLAGLGVGLKGRRASYFYTGANALADLDVAVYAALLQPGNLQWPSILPPDVVLFCEAFALLLDGFMRQTGNHPPPDLHG